MHRIDEKAYKAIEFRHGESQFDKIYRYDVIKSINGKITYSIENLRDVNDKPVQDPKLALFISRSIIASIDPTIVFEEPSENNPEKSQDNSSPTVVVQPE